MDSVPVLRSEGVEEGADTWQRDLSSRCKDREEEKAKCSLPTVEDEQTDPWGFRKAKAERERDICLVQF